MKTLKDFEKDLNKCSKCGQCQIACPIYKLTKNECTVSRGKFLMLLGVTKGDLILSKNINKYLDMCLKCGKCNDYCPAGIDVLKIINAAKHEYSESRFYFKFIKFVQSKLIFTNFINFAKFISEPFRKKYQSKNPAMKVIYFKGCANEILPNTDNYIHKIFNNSDIEIISPNFDCCGLPFLSEGNLERFEQIAKDNIKKLDTNYDYLVTDCASCEDTILNYKKYIECSINTQKSLNWGEIIALKNLKFEFTKTVKVTFHKPCHLKNDLFFQKIIKNCTNVEYVQMQDYDECCGFAGSFALKNYKLSAKLLKNKALNIKNTNADYVITSCPACILGLKRGLHLIGNKKTKVVSLLEFLCNAEKIY